MRHARRLALALLLAAGMACVAAGAGGCGLKYPNGDNVFPAGEKSPAQQLYLLNKTFKAMGSGLADARDAGLVTQAEIDKYQPFFTAYVAASKEAAREIHQADEDRKAGRPVTGSAVEDAVRQVVAAMEPLKPLLAKLGK